MSTNPNVQTRLESLWQEWARSREFRAHVSAIPPILTNTQIIPAGIVKFGLESRLVDEEIRAAAHADRPGSALEKGPEDDDSGPAVHVFDTATDFEYLRFDCFKHLPHYHYFVLGLDGVVTIRFDTAAHGDMVEWICTSLANRLEQMLLRAGAFHMADQINMQVLTDAVRQLEVLLVPMSAPD